MIIDLHAHVTTDVGAQLARARSAGVARTVLLSTRVHPEDCRTLEELRAEVGRLAGVVGGGASAVDEHRGAQAEVRRALMAHPEAVWGFVNAPLTLGPRELSAWLADGLATPGVVGIGELTPPPGRAETIEPALACSDDHGGRPVLVHGFAPNTADDLVTYAALAERHPRVPIIVGAFGGLNWLTLVDLALHRPNLYLDLSSALQVFAVRAAVRALPERCLFGSNTPYGDAVAARATVEAAVDDPALLVDVMGENLARLVHG